MVKKKGYLRKETDGNCDRAFYRHGGQGSAISQTRRRHPFVWEIAGQARNDGKGRGSVVLCLMSKKGRI